MDKIKWCFKQKKGLTRINPNTNMPRSYIGMAEESIKALENLEQSRIWTAATTYYVFYYSLYALLLRLGFKSEIHSCTIAFMRTYLMKYYNNKDVTMFTLSFKNRQNLQYYADRPVDNHDIEKCKIYCKDFFIKTKELLIQIKEDEIKSIRDMVKNDTDQFSMSM